MTLVVNAQLWLCYLEQLKYLGTALTIKILFRKKLRADLSQGMLAVIWCRIFCLSVSYNKIKD